MDERQSEGGRKIEGHNGCPDMDERGQFLPLIDNPFGLFIPTFHALPAVSILGSASFRIDSNAGKTSRVKLDTGDLLSIRLAHTADTTFGTPVCSVELPPISCVRLPQQSANCMELVLEPQDLWTSGDIWFALIPWRDAAGHEPTAAQILSLCKLFPEARDSLAVSLRTPGREIRIAPIWGVLSSLPRRSAESMLFPIHFARDLLSAFIFRLRIGQYECLEGREPLTVHCELPLNVIARLHRDAGIEGSDLAGISVFGNIVPIINVELRGWSVGQSYADFIRSVDTKPLGAIGVYPYTDESERMDLYDQASDEMHIFSVELSSGMVFTGWKLPYETAASHQLLMWMTRAEALNGKDGEYLPERGERVAGAPIIFPLEIEQLRGCHTIIPFFGGAQVPLDENQSVADLLINYSHAPQALLNRAGLHNALKALLGKLGYGALRIDPPAVELRMAPHGLSKFIVARIGPQVDARHCAIIQNALSDQLPMGISIIVEQ